MVGLSVGDRRDNPPVLPPFLSDSADYLYPLGMACAGVEVEDEMEEDARVK